MKALPSYNQLSERWDLLPQSLKDALYSEVGSTLLWTTCEAEHIPESKIRDIARLMGYVLMGFLRPEDMATEIRDSTGIDIRIASSIVGVMNQKIFSLLRPDIDKVFDLTGAPRSIMPKILEEVRPAPKAQISVASPPPAKLPVAAVPPAPSTPQQPSSTKTPLSSMSPQPAKEKGGSSIIRPVIFQTESVPRPILNAPNFKIPTIAEDIMGSKKDSVPVPRPAVVEFGNLPMEKRSSVPSSFAAPTKTTPSITPPRPEPMRTITEITPQTTKPAESPTSVNVSAATFTPLTQIPVPSSAAPKPQSANMPAVPKPSFPLPTPPKPPSPPAPRMDPSR